MRASLLWKLLAVNTAIVGLAMVVVWLAIDFLAADYFMVLMENYDIAPEMSHEMFLDAVHRYLIQVSLFALAVAVGLSYLLTRKILRPLSEMAAVTERIATGDYSARVRAKSNDEVGQLGVAFDQMTERLERIEQSRRRMVADMAHELRTPMTTIRGYLEGLADGVIDPSKETFQMLQQQILRLVRLVEDLNQLTKAEAATVHLTKEAIRFPELVDEALELFRYNFQVKGISVETRFDGDMQSLPADPDKIKQVLHNLIQNAWQYTPEGGQVSIIGNRQPDAVTLSVTNSGDGIDPAELPLIFERFYRTDKSRSRQSGGSGIGLAIAKELVEAHGGHIGAASDPGETRIWFTLPALKDD
ncbi:MAG: ATP-binding protein [Minwuiales bacterium]|nr:ATP-binding protein [Minwuiales bacterium]